MFSKGIAAAPKDSVPSIVSQGTHIVGDVTTDGEVQVDGKVEGNIRCHSLIVSDTGEVTGKVTCETVTIHGVLTGTVQGKSVVLSRTAHLVGDVTHATLEVEPGAHFKGQCIPVVESKGDSKKEGVVVLPAARTLPPPLAKTKEAAGA